MNCKPCPEYKEIGNQWRFDREEIDRWIRGLRQTTTRKASANNG
ncbi:MAG: helix-turn-helix domain-containing protein [Desulfuromonadales bacterium]|nr:helix-turn-helix domain-containing protein [Desulfuromonadales bacterium]